MTLTFLGTRANIAIRSRRHRRHASLLLSGRRGRVLIDCGDDWLGRIGRLRPAAILVTHAHPDHAGGLRQGAPCPVYATAETCRALARWPIAVTREIEPHRAVAVAGFRVVAWPVEHSVNAPAVGFRVSARGASVFYVPDVASLGNPARALTGVDLYVGDGATLERPLVRRRQSVWIGHASIRAQLDWCTRGGVERALFTHCGSALVRADPRRADAWVRRLGRMRGVHARLAHDGMTLTMRSIGTRS